MEGATREENTDWSMKTTLQHWEPQGGVEGSAEAERSEMAVMWCVGGRESHRRTNLTWTDHVLKFPKNPKEQRGSEQMARLSGEKGVVWQWRRRGGGGAVGEGESAPKKLEKRGEAKRKGKEEGGRNSIPPHPKQPQEAKVSLTEEEKTSLLERRKSFTLKKERSKIEACFDNFVSQKVDSYKVWLINKYIKYLSNER